MNLKQKPQKAQNKFIRLCLDLIPRSHKGAPNLRKIILLSGSEREITPETLI